MNVQKMLIISCMLLSCSGCKKCSSEDEQKPIETLAHYCRHESLQHYETQIACRSGFDTDSTRACTPGIPDHLDKQDLVGNVETTTITCNDGKVLAKVLTRVPSATSSSDEPGNDRR